MPSILNRHLERKHWITGDILSVFAVHIVRQNTKVFHVSMDITKSYTASAIHTYICFLQLSKGSVGVATGSA